MNKKYLKLLISLRTDCPFGVHKCTFFSSINLSFIHVLEDFVDQWYMQIGAYESIFIIHLATVIFLLFLYEILIFSEFLNVFVSSVFVCFCYTEIHLCYIDYFYIFFMFIFILFDCCVHAERYSFS